MSLYIGLVHHPINNKRGDVVTTSVTNLDIHDIARSARTFGCEKYFIVTPLEKQHQLVNRILGHWEEDKANDYNPDRSDALSIALLVNSVDDALAKIENDTGEKPLLVVTGANFKEHNADAKKVRELIDNRPILLIFGTGWGLNASIVDRADFKLAPIFGSASDGYNHLSVRSAVAIYLHSLKKSCESL